MFGVGQHSQVPQRPQRQRHRRCNSFPGAINNRETRTGQSARAYNRSVEQRYGLINALGDLLERVTFKLKPIGDFLCKHFSWENLTKIGREAKHQVRQGVYDVQKEMAGSDWKRAKLEAKQRKTEFQHKGSEQVNSIKQRLNRWFG